MAKSRATEERRAVAPKLREYLIPGGFTVLAGKTDEDNDRLSIKIARANDWWFHARAVPGSHVILKVEPGSPEPGRETLKIAAAIAAWHSKAKGGGIVPVSATLAQNVTKPRGAKPGTVEIKKEIVLKVRPALPPGYGEKEEE